MKLQVLSDLHLAHLPLPAMHNGSHIDAQADVVVLAGDIDDGVVGLRWASETFPDKPVVYVAGNHEFYGHHWTQHLDAMPRRRIRLWQSRGQSCRIPDTNYRLDVQNGFGACWATLPVEQTGAGKFLPVLEVFDDRVVQQCALWVAQIGSLMVQMVSSCPQPTQPKAASNCAVVRTPSLRKRRARCISTVRGLKPRARAISSAVCPLASCAMTSRSRGLKVVVGPAAFSKGSKDHTDSSAGASEWVLLPLTRHHNRLPSCLRMMRSSR